MKKIIKNIPIILKKFKFLKYFCIFSILLFMLIDFSSISLLTNSIVSTKNNVLNEIKDLFKKNDEKKKLIYKFLNEFKKEKEVENLISGEIGWGSSIQSLGENKYLVGTHDKGFWFLKFDNDGLVVQANRIQDKDGVDVPVLTTDEGVGKLSSIQSLGENKYLVGTYNKGFWFLKFNDNGLVVKVNKIEGTQDVVVVSDLATNGDVGYGSSTQSLVGDNKYLIGTKNKGFWLLKFDDSTNKFSIANKIQGSNVSKLTADGDVGYTSSIQNLGENKYLVGTNNQGFLLLKFNNINNQFIVEKIKDLNGNDVPDLTKDGGVGQGSSIQKLGENKYLVGTANNGFWFLEFNDSTNKFSIAKRIEGTSVDVNVSELVQKLNYKAHKVVGYTSSIQSLGNNKYLVGTNDKGFWLLKFDDGSNKFSIANKIEGVDVNVSVLTADGYIGSGSSIQSLGENKYLVGTKTFGFWFLKFNDKGSVLQANKIKKIVKVTNDEFDGFYNEKIEKFKNEYKKLQTLSNFESNDKTFWKEFVMEVFVIDEKNKEWKIVDNYSFNKNEIWTEEKLIKFKDWLVMKSVENNDSKWKLWFLIMIPIVPIIIYLLVLFIKKNKKRIIKNNKK